jgi:hypothetical protein
VQVHPAALPLDLIDGAGGRREGNDNLAPGDQTWW